MRFSSLSNPLRIARLRHRHTLKTLGAAARIPYSRLSYLENGLEPRVDELQRLAGVLGVRPEDLAVNPDLKRAVADEVMA